MRQLLCALLVLEIAVPAAAQDTVGATLSMDEAIALAVKNNPTYLQSITARHRSQNALQVAYGALIPQFGSSFGAGYRQGKPQFFNGVAFGANSDVISSSWGLNLSYSVSAGALAGLRSARAQVDASDEDVSSASAALRATVAEQYILALQTAARATLQDSLVTSIQLQLDLAQAKAGVGSATSLDVKRAQVAVGQQQVATLQAHNAAEVAMLQLFQQIGVAMPASVRLTSTFPISEPTFAVDQLLELARHQNPALRALQSREVAATQNYKATLTQYAPSLSFSASIGGAAQQYTDGNYLVNQGRMQTVAAQANCFSQDSLRRGAGLSSIANECSSIVFSPAQAASLRSSNNVFPFGFTAQPYNLSLGLSLPLFDGFGRERRISDAVTLRSDASYNTRAQELKLVADVTSAQKTLVADYRTVRQQETNAQMSREALQLAEERYRVGLNSLVDLQSARSDYATAESGRIDAVYEYHRAFAALESAVGRTLR